jgi:hypothetical protein
MEKVKTIKELHQEHKIWLAKLLFYQDELVIMAGRIAEVEKKNTSDEVLAWVDHFQNQLVIQKEQIDILKHDIKSHELFLEGAIIKNHDSIDQEKFSDHDKHRESIEVFEKIFNELRVELIQFLSRWM